jgi:hypothetical protein
MSHDNLDAIVNQNGFHKLIWSQPMVGWKLGWTSKQSPTSIDKLLKTNYSVVLSMDGLLFIYLYFCFNNETPVELFYKLDVTIHRM